MHYKYNLQKEILEQKNVIKNLTDNYVKDSEIFFKEFDNKENVERLSKIENVILLGCGTSFNVACHGKKIIEKYAKFSCEAVQASEFENLEFINDKTLVIAISQSGETSDVINSVKKLKSKKAFIISILNTEKSTLNKISHVSLFMKSGVEVALTATKSFTSSLFLLNLFILYFAELTKKISKTKSRNIAYEIDKFYLKVGDVLSQEQEVKKIAKKYFDKDHFVFLGKNLNYYLAVEASLKLKETTYIHAEGILSEEFIHGPLAIVDKDYPVCFFLPRDEYYSRNIEVAKKVKQAQGKIIFITNKQDRIQKSLSDDIVQVAIVNEVFQPILMVIIAQLLAYHIAVYKKLDMDNPRNLSKFVLK